MAPRKIGRYEIKDVIGRGGMATVYLAYDPNSKRDVAVKVLTRESLGKEANALERFKKELETIASLEHPTIVPVYDVGEEEGQPFFVMRYMAGGSLSVLIEEGKLSLQDTARIIERIAVALDHAHRLGIIHRDIKPDNILFDIHDNPYISDFGVAKLTEVPGSANPESRVVGTPGYMSPEQAYDQRVDARSDVYGLGVVIYQMLTGRAIQRFSTNTSLDKVRAYVEQPVPDVLKDNPELPPKADTIIKTAMAREKTNRYDSAIDLARALNMVAFGEDRLLNPAATLVDRPGIFGASRSRTRGWLTAGLLTLIAFLGIFAFNGQFPFFSPASPTPSPFPATSTPLPTFTPVPPTFTASPTATPEVTPTAVPMPGGSDQIAILSGNQIYLMNTDGVGLIQVRTDNSPKSNLQWISGNRLVYMARNCIYLLDGATKATQRIACFDLKESLEGFRVSPDEKLVAVTIEKTLNIVPFDLDLFKSVTSRWHLSVMKGICFYTQYSFTNVLWSDDGRFLAARVVDTELTNSDQIFLLHMDFSNCANTGPTRVDKFPGLNFRFSNPNSNEKITSFDWDGNHLFLLNDSVRNDGFGDLYLYDSQTQQETVLNPIDGVCCYRDATWSADRKYILFVFQRYDESDVSIYYIPYADIGSGKTFTPIELPDEFFSTPREKPQPVLKPVQ
ncbi:MAG TPA: protein kinase [Anaerolineales bacterium]|nr:protein kinase [Anaerolineales bacterium]